MDSAVDGKKAPAKGRAVFTAPPKKMIPLFVGPALKKWVFINAPSTGAKPTYEELKQSILRRTIARVTSAKPTYEELKLVLVANGVGGPT